MAQNADVMRTLDTENITLGISKICTVFFRHSLILFATFVSVETFFSFTFLSIL